MNNCIYNYINPFAPEPPVTARADPRSPYRLWRHHFDVISFNGQGQLCLLTCAE